MDFYKQNFTTFFHWFAWTISLSASLFFIVFDVRDSFLSIIADHNTVLIPFLLSLLVAIIGSIYSIFRLIHGGALMLLGGSGIVVYFAFHGGLKEFGMMVAYGLPYIIPGVFFLFIRK